MRRATSNVRALTEEDVPAVLSLHRRAFFPGLDAHAPLPGRGAAYYSEALFANPWRDEGIAPLVYEDATGAISGFVGIIPRPMTFRGEPVRAAVLSSFMVDPERGSPLVAAALLKRALDGGQDLTFGNGANDRMRGLWRSSGRRVVAHLSMRWWRLLRPAGFAAERLSRGGAASRLAGGVVGAAAPFVDRATARPPARTSGPVDLRDRELDAGDLVACIDRAASSRSLRPRYAPDAVAWLLRYLDDPTGADPVRAIGVESGGRLVGWFVERLAGRTAQVLQAGALDGRMHDVLRVAERRAFERGAVTIQGRLDAAILPELWAFGAVLKRGPWFLLDAADERILAAVHAGDGFISSLETASMPADW